MSDDTKTPGFQFGLSDLFWTTAAVGLWLTVFVLFWRRFDSPAVIAIALVGTTAVARVWLHGRRYAWPISAMVGALVSAFCMLPFTAAWQGSRTLGVDVWVIDTDSLQPVAGAAVTIFNGPQSPLEGSIARLKRADFLPNPAEPDTATRMTDEGGRCHFDFKFYASGRDDFRSQTGYVVTSRTWLRVAAPDRPPALVPLDRQSIRPRDLNDTSPLVVTVVMNRGHSVPRDLDDGAKTD